MPAGIEIYNYVTNQKGSPALWSDIFAARPPAGFIGRLFVSTDTFEIYRDNGLTWDLISGGGGPSVNIYNSDGTLTGARVVTMAGQNLTFEGGASTARIAMSANNNVPRIFSFRTAGVPRWAFRVDGNETGSNIGANFALRAYTDAGAFTFSPFSVERRTGEKSLIANETLTTSTANLTGVYNLTTVTMQTGISLTGGNPQAASHNNYTVINEGNYTVSDSIFFGAQSNVLRLQAASCGIITFTQTGGIRSASANLNQIQYDTSINHNILYTHVAVSQNLGIYKLSSLGSLTITNAYGHLINDLNEYGNTNLIITNRWAIYQNSVTDVNYFGGTTLIGTTTNAGFKCDISGTLRSTIDAYFSTSSGNTGIGTTSPALENNVSIKELTITKTGAAQNVATLNLQGDRSLDGAVISRIGTINFWQTTNNTARINGYRSTVNNSGALDFLTNNAGGGLVSRLFISSAGNIGIGISTPVAKVDIVGNVKIDSSLLLVPTTTIPTATAGTLYYDSATNKLKLHDGTSFVDLN